MKRSTLALLILLLAVPAGAAQTRLRGFWPALGDYVSGSGVVAGDLDMDLYDIIDPDVMYQRPMESDLAAFDLMIRAANAYDRAITEINGGPLLLGGGLGVGKATCIFADAPGTILTFTACDATGCTTTSMTEGTHWNRDTDNDLTCAALETYVDGLGLRFATTCVANALWVDSAYTMTHLALTSADGVGGGTKFAVVDGAEGAVVVPKGTNTFPGLALSGDLDTGIFSDSPNNMYFTAAGGTRFLISGTGSGLRAYTFLNMGGNRIYDSGADLNIGGDYAPTKGGVTGAVSIGKDAGNISLEVEGTSHFISNSTFYTLALLQDGPTSRLDLGAAQDSLFFWDTGQTPNALHLTTGTESNVFLLTDRGDFSVAYDVPQQTNPTLVTPSADSTKIGQRLAVHYAGLWADHPVTDIDPHDTYHNSADAWSQATAGQRDGATHNISAGIRTMQLVCADETLSAGDTIVITVNGVATTFTEGGAPNQFDCVGAGSCDACMVDLAAAIVTAAIGLTPDAVTTAGTIYLQPDQRSVHSVDSIAFVDGGADGVFASLVEGVDGSVAITGTFTHNETVTSDAKVTTTDALDNLIASITLADGEVLVVEVTILGRERDGSDRNMYHIKGLFYRQGGAAVQEGVSTYIVEVESDVAWCGDLAVSGNDVQITVDGNGDTVDWEVTYTYQILVSAA